MATDVAAQIPAWGMSRDGNWQRPERSGQPVFGTKMREIFPREIVTGFTVRVCEQAGPPLRQIGIQVCARLPNLGIGCSMVEDVGEGSARQPRDIGFQGFVLMVPAMILDREAAAAHGVIPPVIAPPAATDQAGSVQYRSGLRRNDDEAGRRCSRTGIALEVRKDIGETALHPACRVFEIVPVEP